jgi:hypothetical protein
LTRFSEFDWYVGSMLIPSVRMGMKIQVNVTYATAARTSTRTVVRRGLLPKMIRRVRDKVAVYEKVQVGSDKVRIRFRTLS